VSYRDQWIDEHGADGLRAKFAVYKTADRIQWDALGESYRDEFASSKRIGEDGEFVFVLRPESDHGAWVALGVYAHQVEARSPQLAAGIRAQLQRIFENQESLP